MRIFDCTSYQVQTLSGEPYQDSALEPSFIRDGDTILSQLSPANAAFAVTAKSYRGITQAVCTLLYVCVLFSSCPFWDSVKYKSQHGSKCKSAQL